MRLGADHLRHFFGGQCHAERLDLEAAAVFGLVWREAVIVWQVADDRLPHPQSGAAAVQENDAWNLFGAGGLEGELRR